MEVARQIYGTIPGWLTLFGVVSVAWYMKRGGAVTALDTLVTANRILEDRVKELEKLDRAKDKEIATLSARTDIALALSPITDQITRQEHRAEKRHEALLMVLERIAEHLGPDVSLGEH